MARGRLRRSQTDRVLGGVAGGLAEYFGIDATLVRVLWVLAAISGFGVLAYVVLWIALPEGSSQGPAIHIAEERYARGEITADELARIRQDLGGA
jgi:phage shock protein C